MICTLKRIAPIGLLILIGAGCGLKGPLYRPEEKQKAVASESGTKTPAKRPVTPSPAPQSQKKDAADSGQAPVSAPDPDRPANPEPVTPPGR